MKAVRNGAGVSGHGDFWAWAPVRGHSPPAAIRGHC